MRTRLLVACFCSGAVAIVSAQQAPANKPDTPEVTRMIERLRHDAGPRWADAVHFWCEEPRANRPDDPPIPATKIFDEVFAIGNSGTTVYVIRTSQGLLTIDALGAGDTPGSMGFIFPVHDKGKAHVAALFGGAWLTPQILSDEALRTFRMSVSHFMSATRRAKADVLLQNHMLMDPIQPKLDALAARTGGEPNPFVVGRSEYQKFLKVMDGCTQVNLERRKK